MNQAQIPRLHYGAEDRYAPIPPAERGLQTITAVHYYTVSEGYEQLEGLCFDRNGDLYFVGIESGHLFKLCMKSHELEIVCTLPEGFSPASCKIHKDGRLFLACLGDYQKRGCIAAMKSDGTGMEIIVPFDAGYVPDDLVFDMKGGFYFTDYQGGVGRADGGIVYVHPDLKTITPVVRGLVTPNGVALTPDQKALWVTESCANKLDYIPLTEDGLGTLSISDSTCYYFTGYFGPDSLTIDADGNVYAAMYEQGRVMVFNRFGYPIANILIPGRETGHQLRTEHCSIRPGTDELYICSNDYLRGGTASLYVCRAFAEAYRGHYQFQ